MRNHSSFTWLCQFYPFKNRNTRSEWSMMNLGICENEGLIRGASTPNLIQHTHEHAWAHISAQMKNVSASKLPEIYGKNVIGFGYNILIQNQYD